MKTILEKQFELLQLIQSKTFDVQPTLTGMQYNSKSVVVKYIKDHAFFMSEEVTELLVAIGNGNKAIYKPWRQEHALLMSQTFVTNDEVKSEAIDMLCFCLNICLAVGITPENIDEEYDKVWQKNIDRQHNGY